MFIYVFSIPLSLSFYSSFFDGSLPHSLVIRGDIILVCFSCPFLFPFAEHKFLSPLSVRVHLRNTYEYWKCHRIECTLSIRKALNSIRCCVATHSFQFVCTRERSCAGLMEHQRWTADTISEVWATRTHIWRGFVDNRSPGKPALFTECLSK